MGPSEDARRRLPLPGVVVSWLVHWLLGEADRVGRVHLARLHVDGCLGTAPYRGTEPGQGLAWPGAAESAFLSGRPVGGQARCLSRGEQALVISHERCQ
jgi:hypothetical protein